LQSIRIIGDLLFAVLRDHSGTIQLVWEQHSARTAATPLDFHTQLSQLPIESVIAVKGTLNHRPTTSTNPNTPTGHYEVRFTHLYILSPVTAASLPFDLQQPPPNEEVRLTHRYLDLRRPYLQRLLRLRHSLAASLRHQLSAAGFIEVETPTLFVSSPEGAREFLVPSRHAGLFYALPQSPQQLKQLLMVGGVDRYYQMARCYRDEGQRSDRQPEFTQLDVEMSFVTEADVRRTMEAAVTAALRHCLQWQHTGPLEVRTYREVMDRYGVDKPDLRYGYEIADITQSIADAPQSTDHRWQQLVRSGGVVKALKAEGLAERMTRKELDVLQAKEPLVSIIRIQGDTLHDWKMPASLRNLLTSHPPLHSHLQSLQGGVRKGDLLFVSAGAGWRSVCERMGRVRQWVKDVAVEKGMLRLRADVLRLLWVVDFPLFDMDEAAVLEGEGEEVDRAVVGLCSMHHPFTAPHPADMDRLLPALSSLLSSPSTATYRRSLLRTLSEVRGQHYDLVCNGIELAGGSIRIHSPHLQTHILQLLTQQQPNRTKDPLQPFRGLLTALTMGAPPHGGIAMGLDRFVAMCGAYVEEREGRSGSGGGSGGGSGDCLPIRDVIAFPKTTTGKDLMFGGPSAVSDEQLKEYHIQLAKQ